MSPRSLLDLAVMLAGAADVLTRAGDPEADRLVGLIRQTADDLKTAAAPLNAGSAQSPALDARRWRAGGMTSWPRSPRWWAGPGS